MAKKEKVIVRKTKAKRKAISFEQALDELTAIVARLEDGQCGLDESLQEYEKGMQHLNQCRKLLANAERKIELLRGVDADGNPLTEPFDEGVDVTLEEKAQARGRRRSASGSSKPDDSALFE